MKNNHYQILIILVIFVTNINAQVKPNKDFELKLIGGGNYDKSGNSFIDSGLVMLNESVKLGYEFGIGVNKSINRNNKMSLTFTYSQNYSKKEMVNDYRKKAVSYFDSIYGLSDYYSLDSYNFYINYFNIDISLEHYFSTSSRRFQPFIGGGINLLHCNSFSTLKVWMGKKDTLFIPYYTSKLYYNSRYENGDYNRYRFVDVALNIYGGYRMKLNDKHFIELSLKYLFHPRYVIITYYETTPLNPHYSRGIFMETLSNLSLKLGYVYKLF